MAILMTGSAWAAPGGNGKGQGAGKGAGKGQGLALAKGHEKHAPATPQLTPPAPAPEQDRQEPASARPELEKDRAGDAGSPPGQATRHHHVTICHATGSGRYIVISPNVNGVENGHFRHHDDFVYEGSCRRQSPSPEPDPDPAPPAPPTGDHPPRDPHGGIAGDVGPQPSGNLPFTGVPALPVGLLGGALVAAGWFLVRRKPS